MYTCLCIYTWNNTSDEGPRTVEVELHHVSVGLLICVHEETSLGYSYTQVEEGREEGRERQREREEWS